MPSFRNLVLTVMGASALAAAGFAQAQDSGTIARLTDMEGSVMVSQGDALVAATPDQRVRTGTRVVTLAGGKVVINYDIGCDIRLKENERFTVRLGECPFLLTQVVSLVPGSTVVVAGGFTGPALVLGGIGGGLGYGIYETFRNNASSPN